MRPTPFGGASRPALSFAIFLWGPSARAQGLGFGFQGLGFRVSGLGVHVWGLPIVSMVVPFCGSYLGSYKVVPKRNYYGAYG